MPMSSETLHLIPQPQRVCCAGWVSLPPGEMRILRVGSDPALLPAAEKLADFLFALTEERALLDEDDAPNAFTITLSLGTPEGRPAGNYHRYSIMPLEHGLRLIGEDPVAVRYAVTTLQQVLLFRDGLLSLPLLEVEDGADLAERGFWDYFYPAPLRTASELHTFRTADDWRALLDDLAEYKINLLELLLTDTGLLYQSARFPELVQEGTPADKNALIREVVAQARARGIHLFLTFGHPEHFNDILARRPHLAAQAPRGCQPTLFPRLYCFSQPETRLLFAEIVEEIAELFEPDGLCIWSPENLGHCTCPSCQEHGYLTQYFSIYREAFARLRARYPGMRLRFLASFMRYSSQILEALPPEAELEYYECDRHGLYGFDRDKRLPAHLTAAMQQGRKVIGCINMRGSGQKYVPLPFPDTVAGWTRLLAESGGYGVSGSIYSNPGVNRINILRMADAGWNAAWRDSGAFLAAYAHRHSLPEPAAALLAALAAGWDAYHRLSQSGLLESESLAWLLARRDTNYLDAVYITDALEYRDLPELQSVLGTIEDAMGSAEQAGLDELRRQLRVCAVRLGVLRATFSVFLIYGRQMWPDPEKGPWNEEWVPAIVSHLETARALLMELPALTAEIHPPTPGVQGDPAIRDEKLLALIDRLTAPEFIRELESRAWPDIMAFA
ncbi:MAG: family 20 glycosylhydrolase [Armatimonadota bacterium]